MKWYKKPAWIFVILLLFFPVGLYLIWRYTKWNNIFKAIATGIVLLVAIPFWANAFSSSSAPVDYTKVTFTTADVTAQQQSTTVKELLATTKADQAASTAVAASTTLTTSTVTEPSINPPISDGILRVHYLDVGQADSEFIELPGGKTMLIDAGNSGDGSRIVSYIKNLGYSTIDYLVATHPHADHIGGMADVINSFAIGEIYMPKVAATTQTFEDLLTAIQSKSYTINTAQAGVDIASGITILSPSASSNYGDELNDWSAVISIAYGNNTFLFLGDAGTAPESTFTIDADVVKISHHGSRTAYSSSFYKELSPSIAIISVGADNSYGLPDEEVISGFEAVGATIYRTDVNGTIVLESDGSTVTAKTFETTAPVVPATTTKPTTATTKPTSQPTTAATTTQAPVLDTGTEEVYITNTGSKYHRDGCRYLDESKIAISKADAIAQGYTACKVCDP